MSINILHISDLHFGTKKNEDKSRYNNAFVGKFLEQFKDTKIDYLLVSGDIANESKEIEYNTASAFLNRVVSELNIPKEKVLLCMGNHDISWGILDDIADREGAKDLNLRQEKYRNFEKFYDDFYKEDGMPIRKFKTDSIFVEVPDNEHNILFLGVNTCHKESNQKDDHYGWIEQTSFESYLNKMDPKYKDYVKCLVMHHNPKDLGKEQHDLRNWRDINTVVLGYPLVVFCGHIHGSDGESEVKSDDDETIHYVSVGSLLKKDIIGKYNLYSIPDDTSKLQIKYFNFNDDTDVSRQYWQEQSSSKSRKEIPLKKCVQKDDAFDKMLSDNLEKQKQKLEHYDERPPKKPDIKSSNSILDEIRDHQLFYSGHFHWDTDGNGQNSKFRSHGYIDINYLVSHNVSLEIITRLYKEKINDIQEKTKPDKTIMVSIGLECCVIGARLSVLFPDIGFSYIPRKNNVNDHITIEDKIGLSDYNTVILIKDITFDANEAIEIIKERFENKNIHLISLFYCGKKDEKNEILSGIENAHFHSLIDDIEIPQCDVPESECPIIKNKLQTIYRC